MLTQNAIQILRERYLVRNRTGEPVESPGELFQRVARAIAAVEPKDRALWQERFFLLMWEGAFLPNSPTLMNAGMPEGQLSACFVLPVGDNMHAIFDSLKHTALIHQSGGGTGFDFSDLRPSGDLTGSGAGTASGPVAFMKVFDETTEQVKQGGRRRGANMGVLHCSHPDICTFVQSKSDPAELRNFNISVGITNAFMEAVESRASWSLINPRNGELANEVPARELWELICLKAWETGDPGLLFLDTINAGNTLQAMGPLRATNPCGELPLLPYESCNLGSIALTRMLGSDADGRAFMDWELLEQTIATSMRFLDNVITANNYLLPEIRSITRANRKVGLGLMGWAECLIRLGIPYASEDAVSLAGRLMRFVKEKSYAASRRLAEERGAFPNWDKSIFYPDQVMRNASCNSIAPTGSISVIGGTSYSIEPLYALAFRRVGILDGQEQLEVNPVIQEVLSAEGLWSTALRQEIFMSGGISKLAGIPDSMKQLLPTAHEIPWEYHLAHQRAFQQHTDNAVAKTVNLPRDTPVEVVAAIYRRAWEMGLKGITIYRDSSRPDQVLQHCGATACYL